MEQLALLKEFKLFRNMTDQELTEFASRLTEKTFADKETICRQGEPGECLYLIKEGSAEVSLPLQQYKGESRIVSDLDKGMSFGELSFWDAQECSANVHAKGEVKVLKLRRKDYDDIIAANPESGYSIQRKIILTLAHMIRNIDKDYSYKAYVRR